MAIPLKVIEVMVEQGIAPDENVPLLARELHLSFYYVPDRDALILSRRYLQIPPRADVEDLFASLMRLYDMTTEEEIADHNEAMFDRHIDLRTNHALNWRKRVVQKGYVYVLKMGEYYKIGRSKDVTKRLESIGLLMPITPTLIHTIKTDDMEYAERYMHERFAECRVNGEWFALTDAQIEWICSVTELA